MDAKPQRPIRSVRLHGDENMPPAGPASKTLHHRNKSSPALSTIVKAGGLKAVAKRTAFGDVSNTMNANRSSRDDSVLPSKGGLEVGEKPINLQQDVKPTALLRPAQRPLSVVPNLKGVSNDSIITTKSTTAKLLPVVESQPQANTSKALTRRNTTIFKDNGSSQTDPLSSDGQKPNNNAPLLAPVHRDLNSRQSTNQRDLAQEPEQKLRKVQSKTKVKLESRQTAKAFTEQVVSEEAAVPTGEALGDDNAITSTSDRTKGDEQCKDGELLLEHVTAAQTYPANDDGAYLQQQPERLQQKLARKPMLQSVPEPEEYWDDEEEEDNFDDDGYVTARSIRSRGDNTTGGATTILLPKITQKVRRELAAAKEVVEATRTADEIEEDFWDTTMVVEYGDEIFQYMRELEIKMLPNPHYMDNQAEIQWSMRSVLMDWVVQVHLRFGLLPETLFLCVNYIDRFLSCKIVSLGKLQLVGATAIFVAAKYEEINCPSVQEIVYMVDGGYSVDEILKAERFMLSMLQFELGWPGPMSFLRRISKADDYDLETRTLAKYFLELTVMDERFLGSPPSFAAAGAHCLSRMMLKKSIWSPAHVYYSNYTYSQLYPLVQLMVECCREPQKHHNAVFEKYTDKRYKRSSLFVESEMGKGFRVLDVANNAAAYVASLCDNLQNWDRP